MEPSSFDFGYDFVFDGLDFAIEFSNSIYNKHSVIKILEEELNCRNLVFTEIDNELLRIIDLPYLDDWYAFKNELTAKRFGPFSSEEMLIDYIKKIKTISFNDDRIEKWGPAD